MLNTLKQVLYVLRKGNGFGRIRVVRTYLWLKLNELVRGDRGGELNILGQRIRFGNSKLLVVLFDEIFVAEPYKVSLPSNPRIFDCGANIGMSVAYFLARHPDAEITAFEPDQTNLGFLRENHRRNNWRATIHAHALDKTVGERVWNTFGNTGTLVSGFRPELSGSGPTGTYVVRTERLSSFIDGPIDLLKLDVEGAEHPIIQDLVETGKIASVLRLVMEYHHHVVPNEDELGKLLQSLEEAGFGYDFSGLKHGGCVEKTVHNFMIYAYNKADPRFGSQPALEAGTQVPVTSA